jgi:hypothetical protein
MLLREGDPAAQTLLPEIHLNRGVQGARKTLLEN